VNNSFWRLIGNLRKYKLNVSLSIISNILTAVFTALSAPVIIPFFNILLGQEALVLDKPDLEEGISAYLPYFKYEFSQLILESKDKALFYACLIIVLVFFMKNVFLYLSMVFMAPVRNGITRDIRGSIFLKILNLPLAFFSEERKGDMMSRMSSDVQEIEASILNVLVVVFREPLIILGSLAFMFYVSAKLTIFVFILIIFTGVVIGGIGKTLKKTSNIVQTKLGVLVSMTEEALSGLRIIKGFNAENYQSGKFGQENDEYRNILTRLLWRRDLASPLSEFLGICTAAVLLWYGSKLVFDGSLDATTFLAFFLAFFNVINPAKAFSKAYYNIQKGIAALNRVEEIIYADEAIKDAPDATIIPGFKGSIEYKNVSFAYNDKDGHVVNNINIKIPKGKVVALVGPSGSGKSTLVDLLPRFYDIDNGAILIDGADIKQYQLNSLRALMGIVSQEAILFNDTIYNNIVFGKEGVKEEEVIRAAKIAHAHDFILQTENGYQTNIGDRGNKLSGGQRQRITIARAILKNPDILILDEATSALDSESERLVQEAFVELMKNRTSIVIAHRLSTIQHADEIIVMSKGKIVERGTHDSLLNQAGEYAKLVKLQAFGD
jgi:ABC-type multidrug transport system fused ATPase/permease subunit